jgi:hypothetical protein
MRDLACLDGVSCIQWIAINIAQLEWKYGICKECNVSICTEFGDMGR